MTLYTILRKNTGKSGGNLKKITSKLVFPLAMTLQADRDKWGKIRILFNTSPLGDFFQCRTEE
jgi:hypothetical protein